jgi:hypothetical protein
MVYVFTNQTVGTRWTISTFKMLRVCVYVQAFSLIHLFSGVFKDIISVSYYDASNA